MDSDNRVVIEGEGGERWVVLEEGTRGINANRKI